MNFNPKDHFLLLKGKQYLPVAPRIAWFREEHPDWTITTEMSPGMSGADYVTFKATIADATGKTIATAHKSEHEKHFPDYREKSETGAIGRALALCGYGTLFAQELDEPVTPDGDIRIVDAPQSQKRFTIAQADETGSVVNRYVKKAQDAQPASKSAELILSPAEAMFIEMQRIWGDALTMDDKRGIHNVLIAGHPKAEVAVTKISMEHVTDILKECKSLAQGDALIKDSLAVKE